MNLKRKNFFQKKASGLSGCFFFRHDVQADRNFQKIIAEKHIFFCFHTICQK